MKKYICLILISWLFTRSSAQVITLGPVAGFQKTHSQVDNSYYFGESLLPASLLWGIEGAYRSPGRTVWMLGYQHYTPHQGFSLLRRYGSPNQHAVSWRYGAVNTVYAGAAHLIPLLPERLHLLPYATLNFSLGKVNASGNGYVDVNAAEGYSADMNWNTDKPWLIPGASVGMRIQYQFSNQICLLLSGSYQTDFTSYHTAVVNVYEEGRFREQLDAHWVQRGLQTSVSIQYPISRLWKKTS